MEYIKNYCIIKKIKDLPKIGERRKGYNDNAICIGLENVFDKDEKINDDYILYKALYVEEDNISIYDDFKIDTMYFLYAIRKADFYNSIQ